MTSKLPINLENLLRQRQVEGERIEYKAGWNPDAISLRQRRSVLQPRVARHALPWDTSPNTIEPQRGCVPNGAHSIPTDGTALRFDLLNTHSQGRPHCIRPTLGWRSESRWDRDAPKGMINPTIGAGLDEKLDEKLGPAKGGHWEVTTPARQ